MYIWSQLDNVMLQFYVNVNVIIVSVINAEEREKLLYDHMVQAVTC
jgi:hypothetical protein